MNKLEQYLKKLDQSSYDCRDVHTINAEFLQIREQLVAEGKSEIAAIADLDRQVFLIRKSFDYKLDVEKGTINGLRFMQISKKVTCKRQIFKL